MKFLSHLMKLLHLMTLPSQQFCLCGTLFNVQHSHETCIETDEKQKVGKLSVMFLMTKTR